MWYVWVCALALADLLTQQRLSDLQPSIFYIFSFSISNGKLCEIGNENQIKHAKSSQMLRSTRARDRSADSTTTTTTTTTQNENRCIERERGIEPNNNKKPPNNWLTLTSLYDFSFVWNVLTLHNAHIHTQKKPVPTAEDEQTRKKWSSAPLILFPENFSMWSHFFSKYHG